MGATVRTVNAEVSLKGNANQELGKLNQNLDKSQQGFTSLTDQIQATAGAQSQSTQAMNMWGLAFQAVSTFGIVDKLAEIAFGALSFAWSADEAALSTTGWMRTAQEFIAGFLTPMVEFVQNLVDGFKDLKEWLFGTENGMRLIYAILIAVAPVIAYFLVYGIWILIKATYAWVAANWALIVSYAPLVLMWLAIAAAVALVILVIEDFLTWMQGGESYFGDWLGEWKGFGQAFSDIWSKSTTWIKDRSSAVWEWTKNAASKSWNWIKSFFSGDKSSFTETFWWIAGSIWQAFTNTWAWLKSLFIGTGPAIKGPIGNAINWLRNTFGQAWDWIKDKFWQFSDFLANEFPAVGKFINSYVIQPISTLLGFLQKVLMVLGAIIPAFGAMGKGLGSIKEGFDNNAGQFGLQRGLQPGQQGPVAPSVASSSYQPQLRVDAAFAGGGEADPYGTYLVGENGPEILQMGGRGGTVIPNGKGGGGKVYQIGPFYVNANSDNVGQKTAAKLKEAIDSLFAVEYSAEAGMV